MNTAIKRVDYVSALFTTSGLGNFPDAYFPRKWKGHLIDPSPVSLHNIGNKKAREFQCKNAPLSLLFTHLYREVQLLRDIQGLATRLLFPDNV